MSYEALFFFFQKCSKFNVDPKNAMKKQQKAFGFWDNCITRILVVGSRRVDSLSTLSNNFKTSIVTFNTDTKVFAVLWGMGY